MSQELARTSKNSQKQLSKWQNWLIVASTGGFRGVILIFFNVRFDVEDIPSQNADQHLGWHALRCPFRSVPFAPFWPQRVRLGRDAALSGSFQSADF